MRLVHVIDSLDPAHGGPSTVCVSLAAAQASMGHAVRIVSYDTAGAESAIRRLIDQTPGGSSVEVVWARRPRGLLNVLLATEARRKMRPALRGLDGGTAEFVVIHGVWDRILLAGWAAARRLGVPYCVIPHGMVRPWSLTQSKWKKRAALAVACRRMMNGARFLHALNEEEQAAMRALGLTAPIEVIPNGVFLEQVLPASPGALQSRWPRLAGPDGRARPYVLFLGRLHFSKGLEFLADAFKIVAREHPDVALVVAGPDDGRREWFQQQMAAAGLDDRVVLTGAIYGEEKFAAFAGARCYCLPSRTEGFSVAILEAMASGTPVVISDSCHFPEVAREGAGVVTPLEGNAIATGIRRYLSGTARETEGAAARRLVEAKYTWGRIAERTVGLYAKYRTSTDGLEAGTNKSR